LPTNNKALKIDQNLLWLEFGIIFYLYGKNVGQQGRYHYRYQNIINEVASLDITYINT